MAPKQEICRAEQAEGLEEEEELLVEVRTLPWSMNSDGEIVRNPNVAASLLASVGSSSVEELHDGPHREDPGEGTEATACVAPEVTEVAPIASADVGAEPMPGWEGSMQQMVQNRSEGPLDPYMRIQKNLIQ